MIFSTKLVTQFTTSILTFVLGFIVLHLGLQSDAAVTTILPGFISIVAGAVAGWFVKEEASPQVAALEKRLENFVQDFDDFTGIYSAEVIPMIEDTPIVKALLAKVAELEKRVDSRPVSGVASTIQRAPASVLKVPDGTDGPGRLTAQMSAGTDLTASPTVEHLSEEASGKQSPDPS